MQNGRTMCPLGYRSGGFGVRRAVCRAGRRAVRRAAAGFGGAGGFLAIALAVLASASLGAQVINEVLAENSTTPPADIQGGHPDLLEIYNNTDASIRFGQAQLRDSYYLACVPASVDPPVFDPVTAWPFPPGRSEVPRGGRLTIFCDGNDTEGTCELHASFAITSDGSESIVIWGPEDALGTRVVVDRVWLPPTSANVSWGRFPDGDGGNNILIGEHETHFVRYPAGEASFGDCAAIAGICLVQGSDGRRHCTGVANRTPSPDWNLPPQVARVDQSSNAPRAGDPVRFVVRVRDDKSPKPVEMGGGIDRVDVVYRVRESGAAEFDAEQVVPMSFDATAGAGGIVAPFARPLDVFSLWDAAIPGQPAGAQVEFYFRVIDDGGLVATRPQDLCHVTEIYADGDGPCDREFGPESAGCVRDDADTTCVPDDASPGGVAVTGERYIACNVRSSYVVAHVPRAALADLVINEVVASQTDVLTDFSEAPCTVPDVGPCTASLSRCCPRDANPDCCRRTEDFVEIFNTGSVDALVGGCWLSDSPFDPRRWQFPPGALIPANTRVIVWLDRDGSRCPDNARPDKPCFWECPDPNVLSMQMNPPEFHANFAIDADGDQIFLYDDAANRFGLIHGVDFGDPSSFCGFTPSVNELGLPRNDLLPNQSLSLIPDGDRDGRFVITAMATPRAANLGECEAAGFRRGDASGDGGVDITDGVFVLNFLFLGARAPTCFDAGDADDNGTLELTDAVRILNFLFLGGPPPSDPGPVDCGTDPSDDSLVDCSYEAC